MKRAAGSVLAVALLLAAASARANRFDIRRLSVDGDMLAVVPADLDGDGKLDLLAVYRSGVPPAHRRFFGLFWNRGRAFSARPDAVIPLDERTSCAFDVADVDGQPGAEVLIVTPAGVQARSFRGRQVGAAADLLRTDTLYYQAAPGELPRLPLAQEVGTAGVNDLLVPAVGALEIHRREGGTFTRAARLAITMDTRGRSYGRRARGAGALGIIQVTYAFPALTVADTDGDGRPDIVATLEDRLAIYRQSGAYTFAEQPTFRRDFAVRTPAELSEMSSSAAITVTDIDRDGLADLVVRKQVARGITSAAATSFIYFGRRAGLYPPRADQVIRSEGASGTDVELHDVTGDGRADLVVPSVNIGVVAIVRALTTKTVKVNFQVFPFEPRARRFASQPAAERALKFRLSLAGEAGVQAADMRGDYNGDRRPDLVFGTDDEELSLFPGTASAGLFDEDPLEQLEAPAFGTLEAVDLDRQGKSDMVLHYPATRAQRSQIAVLFNRGPW
jgi:hypothetical protein